MEVIIWASLPKSIKAFTLLHISCGLYSPNPRASSGYLRRQESRIRERMKKSVYGLKQKNIMLRAHEQWVLISLINVQAYEKKTDVAAVTSLLESGKQTDSMNQENRQPALVAPAMTSYPRHDCVDREPGMPKIKT